MNSLPTQQKGLGLIEILVTVLLVSVGFLAAARMQVEGMRFSQGAYFQSQAYFLATDMINRMRTNSAGVLNGEYDNITTSADANNPRCSDVLCNSSEIALQDIYDWSAYFHAPQGSNQTSFIAALPSSDNIAATASVAPLDDNLYAVTLIWSELVGGADTEQTLTLNFALEQQ